MLIPFDIEDAAETTRFLGNEFMMWLWFKTDCYEGLLNIATHGQLEIIIDDYIRLEAYLTESESTDLKGGTPAYSPEAKTALQQGKRISKAKIRVIKEAREWVFNMKGDSLEMTAVKIPALLSKSDEEQFLERMYLIEELEEIVDILYQEFLKIRISPSWDEVLLPALRDWAKINDTSTSPTYPQALLKFEEGTPKTTFNREPGSFNQD